MKIILILFCAATLLATSGCIFREDRGGDDRGHAEHHEHGGDHHDDEHH